MLSCHCPTAEVSPLGLCTLRVFLLPPPLFDGMAQVGAALIAWSPPDEVWDGNN